MNIIKSSFLMLACLPVITSCGGSGGDGRDARNVTGIWRGTLTKTGDACPTSSPASINVAHTVTQNEDAVSLVSEANNSFLGNTVGENGFSVEGTHSTIGQPACTDQTRIEYDQIDSDEDSTANVDLEINRTCPGAGVCTIIFDGTVVR